MSEEHRYKWHPFFLLKCWYCSSAAEEEPGTGSEEESDEESDGVAESSPEELLAIGKKSLAAGDAAIAVDSFQEACSILSVTSM